VSATSIVRLSCRLQQTKISVSLSPACHIVPMLAHGQRDASLLSECHVICLPPYCAGVTQYVFPLQSLSRCEHMRSFAAPAKKTTGLFL